ncbi:MAG TPA: hypothetical protein VFN02_15385 [Ktedonobacteraceae bacterium]|nr:hypothetical protein [Ktedonobacteraceae bacterium]
MADEDEILRFAQDDTVKQLRGMRITADLSASGQPAGTPVGADLSAPGKPNGMSRVICENPLSRPPPQRSLRSACQYFGPLT